MNEKSTGLKGFYILLVGGFLYSLYGVFSRIIDGSIPQFFQIWTRALVIITALLITILFTRTKLIRIKKSDYKWALLIGASSGCLLPLFYIAINKLAIGTTLFSFYATSTIVSYTLGKLLFKEKLSKQKIISLVGALIGLLFLYSDSIKSGNLQYLWFAGISGILFGININSIKKMNNIYPTFQVNLFNWTGGLIINLVISILLQEHWSVALNSVSWTANLGLALCSLFASLSVIYGFKFIEMQKGSIVLLSELIFGVLLGIILYKEIPSVISAFGSVLIFASLLVPNLSLWGQKNP